MKTMPSEGGAATVPVGNCRGFTLIRVLVALAVAGSLLAAASPNIATATRVFGVRSAARQVYSDLQNARMAAVMANQSYTFTVNGGGTSYTITPVPGTAVALDAAGITVSAPNAITFASTGTASTNATVTVSNSFGDALQVDVGPAGRVRVQ